MRIDLSHITEIMCRFFLHFEFWSNFIGNRYLHLTREKLGKFKDSTLEFKIRPTLRTKFGAWQFCKSDAKINICERTREHLLLLLCATVTHMPCLSYHHHHHHDPAQSLVLIKPKRKPICTITLIFKTSFQGSIISVLRLVALFRSSWNYNATWRLCLGLMSTLLFTICG